MLKDIAKGIFISLISTILIQIIFSNIFWTAVFAFITMVFLSLMVVVAKIFKIKEDIEKLHSTFGVFYLILISGVILIIINVPYTMKVPDYKDWPIVPASNQADNAGFKSVPIRIEPRDEIITFQDPLKGSLADKDSVLKLVAGKPTIEIISPLNNISINSDLYITGNSSGVSSNYPIIKIYIIIYNYSAYQVQEVPPPKSNGRWQTKCNCQTLLGNLFMIYAIITTREIKEELTNKFPYPDYAIAKDYVSVRIT